VIRTFLLSLTVLLAQASHTLTPDPPIKCGDCDDWNRASPPFRLFGNTYYVGTAGLSALLVTSPEGHILLDGALPQSAAVIEANIRTLGFALTDVRLILNSHAHFDHAGGINALQRASGAEVATSAAGARALRQGEPTEDDPQFAFGRAENAFPPVSRVRDVKDGETLSVGPLKITAHLTAGHTPGSTTWTWQSCEGSRCLNMVYADSLTAVSAPGFRFTGDATHPSLVERFRTSISLVEQLPCDIIVSTHPGFTRIQEKLAARQKQAQPDPFHEPHGCRAYAAEARKRLEQRVAEERK
jgi:metallo-beta-lactamase class B